MVPSWIAHALYDHCTLVSPAADPDHSGHLSWSSSRKKGGSRHHWYVGLLKGPGLVLPVTGVSVDNFWHNDLFACIGSTGDGGEWRYLVDLPMNLTSHLESFLLLAFWTPYGRMAESHS